MGPDDTLRSGDMSFALGRDETPCRKSRRFVVFESSPTRKSSRLPPGPTIPERDVAQLEGHSRDKAVRMRYLARAISWQF
jgi:hypothetical protein